MENNKSDNIVEKKKMLNNTVHVNEMEISIFTPHAFSFIQPPPFLKCRLKEFPWIQKAQSTGK